MNFLRKHWYDTGGLFALIVIDYVLIYHNHLTSYRVIGWLNLAALFLYQLEEYRLDGRFPQMLNAVTYKSKMPDRYPLNTNTAFLVNIFVGWSVYILAAVLRTKPFGWGWLRFCYP